MGTKGLQSSEAILDWTHEIRFLVGLFCISALSIPLTVYLETKYTPIVEYDLPRFSLLLAYLLFLSTALFFFLQLQRINQRRFKATNLGGYLFIFGLIGLSNSVFLDAISLSSSLSLTVFEGYLDELGFFLIALTGGFFEVSRLDEPLSSWIISNKLVILQLALLTFAFASFILLGDTRLSLGFLIAAFLPTPIRRRHQVFAGFLRGYKWLNRNRVLIARIILNLIAVLLLGIALITFIYGTHSQIALLLLLSSAILILSANYSFISFKTKQLLHSLYEKRLSIYRMACSAFGLGLILSPLFIASLGSVWSYLLFLGFAILLMGWIDRIIKKLKEYWAALIDFGRKINLWVRNTVHQIQRGLVRAWGYCKSHWHGIVKGFETIAAILAILIGYFSYPLPPLLFGFSFLCWLGILFLFLIYLGPLLLLAKWLQRKVAQGIESVIQAIREFATYLNENRLKVYRAVCTSIGGLLILVLLFLDWLLAYWPFLFFGALIFILLSIPRMVEDYQCGQSRILFLAFPGYALFLLFFLLLLPFLKTLGDLWLPLLLFGFIIVLLGWIDRIIGKTRDIGATLILVIKQFYREILRAIGNFLAFCSILVFFLTSSHGSINYFFGVLALSLLISSNPKEAKQFGQKITRSMKKMILFAYTKRYRIGWLLGTISSLVLLIVGLIGSEWTLLFLGLAIFFASNAYYIPSVISTLLKTAKFLGQWVIAHAKTIARTVTTGIAIVLGLWGILNGNIIIFLIACLLLYIAFFGPINKRIQAISQRLREVVIQGLKAIHYALYRFMQVLPLFVLLVVSLGLFGLAFVSFAGVDFTGVFTDSPPMVLVLVGLGYLLTGGFIGHFAIERRKTLRWNLLSPQPSPFQKQSEKRAKFSPFRAVKNFLDEMKSVWDDHVQQ
ncbi:MAG: hypothetical protein ACFFB3_03485 [Candidatus Hodarchaeota archaeon]